MYKLGLLLINILVLAYQLSAILTHYQVQGAHQTPPQQLRAVLTPHLTHNHHRLDPSALQTNLLQLPWVKTLSLQRRLTTPFTLYIIVEEHRPLALWDNPASSPDQQWLVSTEGQIIKVPATDPYLREWRDNHPPIHIKGQWSPQFPTYLPYIQQLQNTLNLHSLECPSPFYCRLQTEQGYTVTIDPQNKPKTHHFFAKIAPQLPLAFIIHVDLRYRHGMAITLQ